MNTGRRERSGGLFMLLCFLLSLGALLGTAKISQAQERTGTITGELKDASGGVLPGATVVLANKTTGRVPHGVTDGAGVCAGGNRAGRRGPASDQRQEGDRGRGADGGGG